MLGYGHSSKPSIRYDIATLVTFIHQFVEAINLPPFVMVGHSLGGWVGTAYALAYPEQVTNMVLIAPAGIRDDSFCGRYDHLRPLLWQSPLVDWILWLTQPVATIRQQQAELAKIRWIRKELQSQPVARSFLVDRMRPEDAIDTVEKDIHRLQIPTLVVAGDRDETIPMWHCKTYATQIPNAQLVTIAEADHDLPQHHAEQLASIIRLFL